MEIERFQDENHPNGVQVLKIGCFLRPLRDTSVPRLFLCSFRLDIIRT